MTLFGPGDFSRLSVPERRTLIKVDISDDRRTNFPESGMCEENTIKQQEKKKSAEKTTGSKEEIKIMGAKWSHLSWTRIYRDDQKSVQILFTAIHTY